MSKFLIRRFLPRFLFAPLWGDRKRWGLVACPEDQCWKKWQLSHGDYYNITQRNGIGLRVNDAAYQVMKLVNLAGKRVLEIGAGDIRHIVYWQGIPTEYILADISTSMMKKAISKLDESKVRYRSLLMHRGQSLPLKDCSIDIIVSFNSLEHLYPLAPYLAEMDRVLVPGGILIGAIPTEGGLAWGGGRMLTSRRWFKKHTTIDPDKIICWEHPNFADEIITALDGQFQCQRLQYWPMRLPVLDINLVVQFLYLKQEGISQGGYPAGKSAHGVVET